MSDDTVMKLVSDNGDESRITLKSRYFRDSCDHAAVEVDPQMRTVECRRCHATLDPIQVLINRANKQAVESMNLDRLHEYRVELWQKRMRGVPLYGRRRYKDLYDVVEMDCAALRCALQFAVTRLRNAGLTADADTLHARVEAIGKIESVPSNSHTENSASASAVQSSQREAGGQT